MSTSSSPTNKHRIEAQILVEATGDYDDYDIKYIMDTYDVLAEHIGWTDKRLDKRYIVKFHKLPTSHPLFDAFCRDVVDYMDDFVYVNDIRWDRLLTQQCVGHYQAFVLDMPEITEDNAVELAMRAYDEFTEHAPAFVRQHILLVDKLQEIEDNYVSMWNESIQAYNQGE